MKIKRGFRKYLALLIIFLFIVSLDMISTYYLLSQNDDTLTESNETINKAISYFGLKGIIIYFFGIFVISFLYSLLFYYIERVNPNAFYSLYITLFIIFGTAFLSAVINNFTIITIYLI